jgi:uncharacterized protein (TIGR02466 family)
MTMHENLKLLFPTPIWEATIGDDKLNSQLETAIYEIEQNDKQFEFNKYPFGYTNYMTGNNLAKDSRFKPLAKKIFVEARKFLAEMKLKEPDTYYLSLFDMFCNINRKYSRHNAHRHERSELSGVYYVKVPEGSADLIGHSPLEPLMMHVSLEFFEENSHFTKAYQHMPPQTGKLLIFPSWFLHEVDLHLIDEDRLSISFNMGIFEKSDNNIGGDNK